MDVLNKLELIRRGFYLERLLHLTTNDNLVFVVGVRRSGKSCLAIQLEDDLRERCTEHEHVFRYNFETTEAVRETAETLIARFQEKHVEGERCYILLDEVTHVSGWRTAVNYFAENPDCKLFLFSSNRRIISDKLTAVEKKKYDVVDVLPLSLPEFISFQNFEEITPENTPLLKKRYRRFGDRTYTITEIYKYYITYGGIPILKPEYMDIERARVITDGSYSVVVTRDILEIPSEEGLSAVTDPILLRSVITIMAKSIGDNISATGIGKQTVNCLQRPAAAKTVESYIRALINANLFYIAERCDVRSEKAMKTMAKYYMVDASLHNYITGVRPEDESRLLESKVFFELVRRGYQVCNGKLGNEEIHLVAKDKFGRFYIQVADELNNDNRDFLISPLRKIRDNHPKIVIVFNGNNEITKDGIIILNALEFLMGHPLGR